MIRIEIPGRDVITVEHLVLDYNGTVAEDGRLIEGVEERMRALKDLVEIHVLTAAADDMQCSIGFTGQ